MSYRVVSADPNGKLHFANDSYYNAPRIIFGTLDESKKVFSSSLSDWCRDILVYSYADYLIKKHSRKRIHNGDLYIFKDNPFIRAQFVLMFPEKMSDYYPDAVDGKSIKHAVKLLNKLEKTLKWKRTKLQRCIKPRSCAKGTKLWLITGSRCWVNNPYFMYIYLAVFKVMVGWPEDLKYGTKTVQDLFVLAKKKLTNGYPQYEHMPEWLDVVRHRKEIFEGFTTKTLYTNENAIKSGESLFYGLGIHTFLNLPGALRRVVSDDGVLLSARAKKWCDANIE